MGIGGGHGEGKGVALNMPRQGGLHDASGWGLGVSGLRPAGGHIGGECGCDTSGLSCCRARHGTCCCGGLHLGVGGQSLGGGGDDGWGCRCGSWGAKCPTGPTNHMGLQGLGAGASPFRPSLPFPHEPFDETCYVHVHLAVLGQLGEGAQGLLHAVHHAGLPRCQGAEQGGGQHAVRPRLWLCGNGGMMEPGLHGVEPVAVAAGPLAKLSKRARG